MQHERRRFLYRGIRVSGLLLLGWRALPALAQDKPMLDPNAYQAQALHYVDNAPEADDDPAYRAGRYCENCTFFHASNQGCDLFPDYRVASQGWCSSWTSRGSR